ncbi:hypothetical protein ILYODFUR_005772 [Ilyodon furcidens]|uniref:Uncharacterized protein n=1 Tax=Ilyodon furcidens TaxID=33524 RepID=A0ABV0TTE3_9TELE
MIVISCGGADSSQVMPKWKTSSSLRQDPHSRKMPGQTLVDSLHLINSIYAECNLFPPQCAHPPTAHLLASPACSLLRHAHSLS